MKYILILLTLSTLSLQAFDSLLDHEKLGGSEEVSEKIIFGKTISKKTASKEIISVNKKITENSIINDAFITPMELKNSLNDNNIIIFDVDNISIYNKGHINGAIHVDVNKFIVMKKNPYKLMKSDSMIKDRIVDLGINKDSKVIIYAHNTEYGNLNSSYLAFILITFGFENVSILDGGFMAWVFENERLVSSKSSKVKDDGNFIPNKNTNIIVDEKYVLDNISNLSIIDAREEKYYFGTHKSKNIKEFGHIKGAKSSYYRNKFLIDGTLREKNELNNIYYLGHELKKNDEIIVYADNVFKASMEWYMLYKVMKFKNTKIYEASLLEYFNTKDNPTTRFKWE